MRRTVAALLMMLAASSAQARTGANPDGRDLPIVAVPNPASPGAPAFVSPVRAPAPARVAAAPVPVPLPAGAEQVDSTWYDLQDLGSLGIRIVTTPDLLTYVAWMDDFCEQDAAGCPPNVNAPQPFPRRGMGVALRSPGGSWTRLGKVQDPSIRGCCLTELLGGFGTLAALPDGRVAISQHMNEDGCDLRGDLYLEGAPGAASWNAYLGPIQDPSFLFPQVVALPNGTFVMLAEVPRVTSGCTHCGVNNFAISRLTNTAAHFVCPTGWQMGPWTSVANPAGFRNGYPCFPALAAASDGRVGIAVTDFGGNVRLFESSDGTFAPATITVRNLTNDTDATVTATDSTSTQYRPYIHCHLAYNDTTPNVVWSELQARRQGGAIVFADYRSRIRHWNPVTGVTTVKQVQPGEADSYDNVDNGWVGPLSGFNTISVDWPQVGFSSDGSETIVGWLRFVDAEIDTSAHAGAPDFFSGVGFGDVACSVRHGGSAWSAAQNLTATPATDERFFSIAASNPPGRVRIVFQASATNQAGTVQGEDRGAGSPLLLRRIAYLERPLAGSVLAVNAPAPAAARGLRVSPNPARGAVRFTIEGSDRAPGTVLIHSVNGAVVARIPLGVVGTASWDGRDRSGKPLASGVYFVRLEGRGGAVKLLLMN
jgi:hypothetical protein